MLLLQFFLLLVHAQVDLDPPAKSVGCKVDVPDHMYAYDGMVNVTENGHTCQDWRLDEPHIKKHGDGFKHNYCRNADGLYDPPWCYTTDANVRWDYCDIGTEIDPMCIYRSKAPTITPTSQPTPPPSPPTEKPTKVPTEKNLCGYRRSNSTGHGRGAGPDRRRSPGCSKTCPNQYRGL